LQEKFKTFEAFQSFKTLAEKDSGNPIKVFGTDRGGEHKSGAFAYFYAKHGIKRQLTTTYSPQPNDICE